MSSSGSRVIHEGSPFVSHSPNDDRAVWERLHELLSLGYDTLLRTPGLDLEVITLSNTLRGKLFLFADSFFLDLSWELFSLLPSSLYTARQTIERIRDLDPIIQTADSLSVRISKESAQLLTLREEHSKADQLTIQLDEDLSAAAHARDYFSELIREQGESPSLRLQLTQTQRLVEHLIDFDAEATQETDDLADIIRTKTHRLAALEVERAGFQRDVNFHARLLADLHTLEIDLKILTAKIRAYFRFM